MSSAFSLWTGAFQAEGRKALANPVPWIAGLAVLLFPLIAAGFMLIVRDPEGARSLGILSTKARLSGLSADWPAYLGFINQALCAGFLFLEALLVSWIFGREWSDRTLKLLLAVPAGRARIVGAKFAVILVWGLVTLALLGGITVGMGNLLNLSQGSEAVLIRWAGQFALAGVLTLILGTWTAFFASWGGGYLIPVAWTLVTLMAAQLGAVLGWAGVVPWAIPALAGLDSVGTLDTGALVLALGTAGAGVVATVLFWNRADHHR